MPDKSREEEIKRLADAIFNSHILADVFSSQQRMAEDLALWFIRAGYYQDPDE